MTARTDRVRTLETARECPVIAIDDDGGDEALIATGRLQDFACAFGHVREVGDGVVLSSECAKVLGIRAIVEVVEPGSIPRTDFKARRVVDDRAVFRDLRAQIEGTSGA